MSELTDSNDRSKSTKSVKKAASFDASRLGRLALARRAMSDGDSQRSKRWNVRVDAPQLMRPTLIGGSSSSQRLGSLRRVSGAAPMSPKSVQLTRGNDEPTLKKSLEVTSPTTKTATTAIQPKIQTQSLRKMADKQALQRLAEMAKRHSTAASRPPITQMPSFVTRPSPATSEHSQDLHLQEPNEEISYLIHLGNLMEGKVVSPDGPQSTTSSLTSVDHVHRAPDSVRGNDDTKPEEKKHVEQHSVTLFFLILLLSAASWHVAEHHFFLGRMIKNVEVPPLVLRAHATWQTVCHESLTVWEHANEEWNEILSIRANLRKSFRTALAKIIEAAYSRPELIASGVGEEITESSEMKYSSDFEGSSHLHDTFHRKRVQPKGVKRNSDKIQEEEIEHFPQTSTESLSNSVDGEYQDFTVPFVITTETVNVNEKDEYDEAASSSEPNRQVRSLLVDQNSVVPVEHLAEIDEEANVERHAVLNSDALDQDATFRRGDENDVIHPRHFDGVLGNVVEMGSRNTIEKSTIGSQEVQVADLELWQGEIDLRNPPFFEKQVWIASGSMIFGVERDNIQSEAGTESEEDKPKSMDEIGVLTTSLNLGGILASPDSILILPRLSSSCASDEEFGDHEVTEGGSIELVFRDRVQKKNNPEMSGAISNNMNSPAVSVASEKTLNDSNSDNESVDIGHDLVPGSEQSETLHELQGESRGNIDFLNDVVAPMSMTAFEKIPNDPQALQKSISTPLRPNKNGKINTDDNAANEVLPPSNLKAVEESWNDSPSFVTTISAIPNSSPSQDEEGNIGIGEDSVYISKESESFSELEGESTTNSQVVNAAFVLSESNVADNVLDDSPSLHETIPMPEDSSYFKEEGGSIDKEKASMYGPEESKTLTDPVGEAMTRSQDVKEFVSLTDLNVAQESPHTSHSLDAMRSTSRRFISFLEAKNVDAGKGLLYGLEESSSFSELYVESMLDTQVVQGTFVSTGSRAVSESPYGSQSVEETTSASQHSSSSKDEDGNVDTKKDLVRELEESESYDESQEKANTKIYVVNDALISTGSNTAQETLYTLRLIEEKLLTGLHNSSSEEKGRTVDAEDDLVHGQEELESVNKLQGKSMTNSHVLNDASAPQVPSIVDDSSNEIHLLDEPLEERISKPLGDSSFTAEDKNIDQEVKLESALQEPALMGTSYVLDTPFCTLDSITGSDTFCAVREPIHRLPHFMCINMVNGHVSFEDVLDSERHQPELLAKLQKESILSSQPVGGATLIHPQKSRCLGCFACIAVVETEGAALQDFTTAIKPRPKKSRCFGSFSCIALTDAVDVLQEPATIAQPPSRKSRCLGAFTCIALTDTVSDSTKQGDLDAIDGAELEAKDENASVAVEQALASEPQGSRSHDLLLEGSLKFPELLKTDVSRAKCDAAAEIPDNFRSVEEKALTAQHATSSEKEGESITIEEKEAPPLEIPESTSAGQYLASAVELRLKKSRCLGSFTCIALADTVDVLQEPATIAQPPSRKSRCLGAFTCIALTGTISDSTKQGNLDAIDGAELEAKDENASVAAEQALASEPQGSRSYDLLLEESQAIPEFLNTAVSRAKFDTLAEIVDSPSLLHEKTLTAQHASSSQGGDESTSMEENQVYISTLQYSKSDGHQNLASTIELRMKKSRCLGSFTCIALTDAVDHRVKKDLDIIEAIGSAAMMRRQEGALGKSQVAVPISSQFFPMVLEGPMNEMCPMESDVMPQDAIQLQRLGTSNVSISLRSKRLEPEYVDEEVEEFKGTRQVDSFVDEEERKREAQTKSAKIGGVMQLELTGYSFDNEEEVNMKLNGSNLDKSTEHLDSIGASIPAESDETLWSLSIDPEQFVPANDSEDVSDDPYGIFGELDSSQRTKPSSGETEDVDFADYANHSVDKETQDLLGSYIGSTKQDQGQVSESIEPDKFWKSPRFHIGPAFTRHSLLLPQSQKIEDQCFHAEMNPDQSFVLWNSEICCVSVLANEYALVAPPSLDDIFMPGSLFTTSFYEDGFEEEAPLSEIVSDWWRNFRERQRPKKAS